MVIDNHTKEFRDLLSAIENASDAQIGDIIKAVIRRYKTLFPQWQVVFLSIPRDEAQREESIERLLEFLKTHKTL